MEFQKNKEDEPVAYTCSLGHFCHTSMALKTHGLKRASYPFDWVFTDLAMIMGCIKDDFSVYLDKSQYTDHGKYKAGHRTYHTFFFNHHNPLTQQEDYEYFQRCCQRFRDLLKEPERKLFIVLYPGRTEFTEELKKLVREFNDEFKKYTKNYTILAICQIPYKERQWHEWTSEEEIDFLELHTYDKSWGEKYRDGRDEYYMGELIKNRYTYNLKQIHKTN